MRGVSLALVLLGAALSAGAALSLVRALRWRRWSMNQARNGSNSSEPGIAQMMR